MADQRLLIIGVGNPDRGDDGAGHAVIKALRARIGAHTDKDTPTLIEQSGESTLLIEAMQGLSNVVIVDAADFGAKPGSHRRFDAGKAALPSDLTNMSSHGFGVPQAIELARALGTLPERCTVYAIQAASFEAGDLLSTAVATATDIVATKIFNEFIEASERSHA